MNVKHIIQGFSFFIVLFGSSYTAKLISADTEKAVSSDMPPSYATTKMFPLSTRKELMGSQKNIMAVRDYVAYLSKINQSAELQNLKFLLNQWIAANNLKVPTKTLNQSITETLKGLLVKLIGKNEGSLQGPANIMGALLVEYKLTRFNRLSLAMKLAFYQIVSGLAELGDETAKRIKSNIEAYVQSKMNDQVAVEDVD